MILSGLKDLRLISVIVVCWRALLLRFVRVPTKKADHLTMASKKNRGPNLTKRRPPEEAMRSEADKFRDPIESDSDKISSYLNQFHAGTLLLIAWHFANKRDTVIAQMVRT